MKSRILCARFTIFKPAPKGKATLLNQRGLKIEGRIPLIVMKGKFTKVKRNSHVGEDAKFISYGLRRTRTILKKRLPKLIQRASIGHVLWVMMEHLLE